jgi:diphthamide biosynthesis enzyme Dph1/Dph2-like protein
MAHVSTAVGSAIIKCESFAISIQKIQGCIDDYSAKALGCDLLVHYGHSCLGWFKKKVLSSLRWKNLRAKY